MSGEGPKYPQIHIQLTGTDGNAFSILGRVRAVMRQNGVPADELTEFTEQATSGDYDHLLRTCMRWVTVR